MKTLKNAYLRRKTAPIEDGFSMPAEYAPHLGTMMIWPHRSGSWRFGAVEARQAFRKIIWKLAENENVYVLVREEDLKNAEEMLLKKWQKNSLNQRIVLILCDSDDAWARDTGPTFVLGKRERRGIDWNFNAWGGNYDGLYATWEKDQEIASHLCKNLGDSIYDARHFILEGGSIHVDGEGTLLTTEECLLSPGRNAHLSKNEIENELKKYLGVEKIIWIPEGIYNDETNGHIDNMCAFVGPAEVVLAWTDNPEDPQYERSHKAYQVLNDTFDAKGRPFIIHKMYIPDQPICITEEDLKGYTFEDGEDIREIGERLAASYVNFYIGNKCVLLPQFGDNRDKEAVQLLKKCFPEREIVPIDAREILAGGGNIHCITQQIPLEYGGSL